MADHTKALDMAPIIRNATVSKKTEERTDVASVVFAIRQRLAGAAR